MLDPGISLPLAFFSVFFPVFFFFAALVFAILDALRFLLLVDIYKYTRSMNEQMY